MVASTPPFLPFGRKSVSIVASGCTLPEAIERFEQIRAKLERQEVADLQPLGQSFQVST